jgi:hypothetical protein
MTKRMLWLIALLLAAQAAHATPTTKGGQQYIDECLANGVPRPPDWGSPLWLRRANNSILTDEFISWNQEAEVFHFISTNPEGICMALPRSTGNTITLLGIICQSKQTGKACFWDNVMNKQAFFVQKGESVPIVSTSGGRAFSGGIDLLGASGGVCTTCHLGENAFIVHPGGPLDFGDIAKPNVWYDPIVPESWPDNPGPSTLLEQIPLPAGEGSCLQCHGAGGHRFPQLSNDLEYCDLRTDDNDGLGELASAISAVRPLEPRGPSTAQRPVPGTMPPGAPGSANFLSHMTALRTACMMPPPTTPQPPAERMLTPAELYIVTD